jgi:hypothetical protein
MTGGEINLVSDDDSGTIHLEITSSEDEDGIVFVQKKSRINSSSKSSGSSLQLLSGRNLKRSYPLDNEDDEDDVEEIVDGDVDPVRFIPESVSITTYSYFSNYLILTLSILFISLSTLFSLYTAWFWINN